MATAEFTDVETCILSVLSDGMPHKRGDLKACLCDHLADFDTVRVHLSRIRKKLPPDEEIICQFFRREFHYRHIRKLTSNSPRNT